MSYLTIIVVAVAGALGGLARFAIYVGMGADKGHRFPWETFLVNMSGCLALGFFMAYVDRIDPHYRTFVLVGVTGFIGSYTTFSTFGFETLQLMRSGQLGLASLNVMGNVAIGLGALALGRSVGLMVASKAI